MDLALRLRERTAQWNASAHAARLFDAATEEGHRGLSELLASSSVVVVDELAFVLEELVRTRRPKQELTRAEVDAEIAIVLGGLPLERFGRWAYYPWSDRLVHVLPPELHVELRLDRNRHKITASEQRRLLALRIGIVGLSVGRAISSTLIREGVGGELRLADFDTLSLSNLNRLEGSVADVGIN
jgi:hypothetical protein